jgi:hypothetical protein
MNSLMAFKKLEEILKRESSVMENERDLDVKESNEQIGI